VNENHDVSWFWPSGHAKSRKSLISVILTGSWFKDDRGKLRQIAVNCAEKNVGQGRATLLRRRVQRLRGSAALPEGGSGRLRLVTPNYASKKQKKVVCRPIGTGASTSQYKPVEVNISEYHH
jgi:hypothetical protein